MTIAILLCILGFFGTYLAGRRSLALGCLVVIAFGNGYGILRANLFTPFSHFIFDSALAGLYCSEFIAGAKNPTGPREHTLRQWVMLLVAWPTLLLLLPFQVFLVSLVGLRGNVFMLPALLIGARLTNRDLQILAFGLTALNLVALAFGSAEYFMGIEPFYPYSPVTTTIYASLDGANHLRIPSTFSNAHSYAGVMTSTIPFLFGAWAQPTGGRNKKLLLLLGMVSALLGVLLAATRVGMVIAMAIILIASLSGNLGLWKRIFWIAAIAAIVISAMNNERWSRYKSLGESDVVEDRIAGSVNRSFFEILLEYPIGNGLGGGGTSIPYFLAARVNQPVAVENEYGRILLEQGVVGLLLFVAFEVWFWTRRTAFEKNPWLPGRRLGWFLCSITLASALIGTGMMTSVPLTFILLLTMGWVAVKPAPVVESLVLKARPSAEPVAVGSRA